MGKCVCTTIQQVKKCQANCELIPRKKNSRKTITIKKIKNGKDRS